MECATRYFSSGVKSETKQLVSPPASLSVDWLWLGTSDAEAGQWPGLGAAPALPGADPAPSGALGTRRPDTPASLQELGESGRLGRAWGFPRFSPL